MNEDNAKHDLGKWWDLLNEDWCFDSIPKNQLFIAWAIELDRDCGSGKPSFLSFPSDIRQMWANWNFDGPVQDDHFANDPRSAEHMRCYSIRGYGLATHVIEINWNQSPASIVAGFEKWMETMPQELKSMRKSKRRAGRSNDYLAWLKDLAVYRLSMSWPRKQAIEIIKKSWPDLLSSTGTYSESHWCDAKKRTKERIEARIKSLKGGSGRFLFIP